MTEEPLERVGRSLSMVMGRPAAIPRSSPSRSSPTNTNLLHPSGNRNILLKGQRLRAATSFSQHLHTPSSMAIRRTGITGGGGGHGGGVNVNANVNHASGKSLAAIAGPMGITIVDVAAPQRPWLVLDHSSSLEESNNCSSNIGSSSGGITTMAFQPCLSTVQQSLSDADGSTSAIHGHGGGDGYNISNNYQPVLLATARGSGILIWDCSGRALSPLLGRLNASDSWSGGSKTVSRVRNDSSVSVGKRNNMDEDSMESAEGGNNNKPSLPPLVVKSESSQDALKSLVCSPNSLERMSSLISVSSSSSLVTSNANNMLPLGNPSNNNNNISATTGASSTMATTKNSAASTSASANKGNVTSLDWKGPLAPILLSTCGNSACVWDLRTSIFSGVGGGRGSGARPNARFTSPEDDLSQSHPGSSLIHCAYSHDDASNHTFATLDSAGVVRVWDDRKADYPRHSFMGCPGGGVGIASIAPPPSRMGSSVGPTNAGGARWATWGMDELQHHDSSCDNNDLVVKVWTESSLTPKSRKNTSSSSNASTKGNAADLGDRNGEGGGYCDPVGTTTYNMTSRISMTGAVAARVHPSFSDGILLFRDNPSERETLEQMAVAVGGLSTHIGFGASAAEILKEETTAAVVAVATEGLIPPGLKMRSPEMAAVVQQTPPSPPPLMLEDTIGGDCQEVERPPLPNVSEGWEAELWSIDNTNDSPVAFPDDTDEAKEANHFHTTFGARKVAGFRGGGSEEDALSFVPGRGDVSDVIAVDLALSAPVMDGENLDTNQREEELSLCVLTEACRLTVYGIPEATELLPQKKPTESVLNKLGRVDRTNMMPRSAASRVYRQGSADHHASSWWNKNEEEDLFGDNNITAAAALQEGSSPKKSSMESMRSTSVASAVEGDDLMSNKNAAIRALSQRPENIDEKASSSLAAAVVPSSLIPDVELAVSMEDAANERDLDTTGGTAANTGDPVQNNNIPIDPAVAARVPCPPLCGVAFSGVGTTVTFNNGPVKRMWSHYQSHESFLPMGPDANRSNLSDNFSFKPHVKKESDVISSATSDDEDSSSLHLEPGPNRMHNQQAIGNQALPRTLADLIEMNLRSQTLQWGDAEQQEDGEASNDDGNSTSSSDGSSSYEDPELMVLESDESGRMSASDDDSEGFYHVVSSKDSIRKDSLDGMFNEYFSTDEQQDDATTGAEKFAGLPSLSPSVLITRKHDDIILNGQTPELSNLLKLGEVWWLTEDFTTPGSTCNLQNEKNHSNSLEASRGKKDTTFPCNSSDPHLLPSPFSDETLARSSSFSPMSKSKHTSMIGNLKKLFAHQLPTAMAPPDQRLLNSKSKQKSAQLDQSTDRPDHGSGTNFEGECSKVHLGVYMLENPQTPEAASEQLAFAHKLCTQNAQICSECGQKAKADTWTLLAQTIESIFTFEMDETDGWGGHCDALTTGVVEQILRYYEAAGDFQMLSTIVCVLTFGRDRRSLSRGAEGRYQLLPKFDERRYDNYIHRYAALLYGWDILTVRSEVSKRLAYNASGAGTVEKYISEHEIGSSKSTLQANSGSAPGAMFMPVCGRCAEPVTDVNNICPKCNEYAFQCSICCSAVRGACTWCPLCGHGGHVDHMMQWFQHQTVCPTGCGCICMIGNSPPPTYPPTNY